MKSYLFIIYAQVLEQQIQFETRLRKRIESIKDEINLSSIRKQRVQLFHLFVDHLLPDQDFLYNKIHSVSYILNWNDNSGLDHKPRLDEELRSFISDYGAPSGILFQYIVGTSFHHGSRIIVDGRLVNDDPVPDLEEFLTQGQLFYDYTVNPASVVEKHAGIIAKLLLCRD
jgi:hypothetical protein